jgi:hypothetical protein
MTDDPTPAPQASTSDYMREIHAQIAGLISPFLEQQGKILEAITLFRQRMMQIESAFPEDAKTLAQAGWFVEWWYAPISDVPKIAQKFRTGLDEQGDTLMINQIASSRNELEATIYSIWPDRAGVLRKTFAAHDSGGYELSIPVFLAQADGISAEVLGLGSVYSKGKSVYSKGKSVYSKGKSVYSKGKSVYSKGKSVVSTKRRKISEISEFDLERAFLSIILERLPLTIDTNDAALIPVN